jgi:hypothetical protein
MEGKPGMPRRSVPTGEPDDAGPRRITNPREVGTF